MRLRFNHASNYNTNHLQNNLNTYQAHGISSEIVKKREEIQRQRTDDSCSFVDEKAEKLH